MKPDLTPDPTPPEALREALRASEARFRNIIEKNADGMIVVSPDGVIRFVNPAAEALLGRPAGQLLGQAFGVPVVPGETTEIDLVRGGRPARVAEMRAVDITWEGGPASLASLRDVTGRKQAAEAARFLADAGALLADSLDFPTTLGRVARLCVSHLADGCLIDVREADGRLRCAALAHRDASREEWAQPLRGRSAPEGAAPAVAHALRRGRPKVYPEVPEDVLAALALAPEAVGALRAFGCASAILLPLSARGHTLGLVTLTRGPGSAPYGEADLPLAEDLARRAAMALDNTRLYDEAQDAVRRRDEFLAMLAHELRNPLAPIRNAMELMRQKDNDDPELRWIQAVVERQVKHLGRLVDDLLDVSRITRGKIQLRKEPVELAAVVSHAVETSRPLIEARGHRLDVRLPANAGRVQGDPTRLAQVLSNLLNNAAKFTPDGGLIGLSVERGEREAVVRVADRGVGIPPEVLPRIFDLFAQEDSTLERSQGGLGIGLTLVRSLVEMHGGSVEAFSEGRGRGSEFVVRLPLLADAPAATRPADADGRAAATIPRRILVVDDNRDSAESLAMLLRVRGHDVQTAYDGLQAVEAARRALPDLVLCDLALPGISGYQVAQQIRALPEGKQVRLTALSGFGTSDDLKRSAAAGFDAHLVKPVEPDALRRLLEAPPAGK